MFTGLQVRGNVAEVGAAVEMGTMFEESKPHTGVGNASTDDIHNRQVQVHGASAYADKTESGAGVL